MPARPWLLLMVFVSCFLFFDSQYKQWEASGTRKKERRVRRGRNIRIIEALTFSAGEEETTNGLEFPVLSRTCWMSSVFPVLKKLRPILMKSPYQRTCITWSVTSMYMKKSKKLPSFWSDSWMTGYLLAIIGMMISNGKT